MIKKLDIPNYGTYKNYQWNQYFGEDKEGVFGARNIIYGRNYSGKTTLSRIFRCLEKGDNHRDFKDGEYYITLDNDERVSHFDFPRDPLNIRVYNSDFIKENLDFLNHEEGDIRPFAILGRENVDTQIKIDRENKNLDGIRKDLGKTDNEGIKKDVSQARQKHKDLKNEIEKKLQEKASTIRNNPHLFVAGKKKKYDKRDLENEIPTANRINETRKEELESILKEEVKEEILSNPNINLDYIEILKEANEVLSIEVQPSKVIQDLLSNDDLQEWVKEGITLHKGERQKCAFCGNNIEQTRWDELDKHFTKQVDEFIEKLDKLIPKVLNQLESVKKFKPPIKNDNFYSVFQRDINSINNRLESIKEISISNLQTIYNKLNERRKNVFSNPDVIEMKDDVSSEIISISNELSELISDNNEYTQQFSEKQKEARELLRSNEVYNFKSLFDYDQKVYEKNQAWDKLQDLEEKKKDLFEKERSSMNKVDYLVRSLKDEENSIKQVNYYLQTFLGHNELYLDIEEKKSDKDKVTRFTVMRNNIEAKNLSEGERSLVAFCYFLATLKDIENVEEYTIFIDDPISSLDSNHIFYIFSLLNSEIASEKYEQVFISTHNLDFFKYIQRLTRPTNNKKYKNKYYLIEKNITTNKETKAILKNMPDYLKNYSTEFIYLFHQIYIVANYKETDKNYQSFYNFPNIARKFLETYMFFKYPDYEMNNDQRIQDFFNDDITFKEFLNRINNEFSHGENQPDRLFRPIDIPEFKKNAKIILNAIENNDWKQYNALLNSIGEFSEKETNKKEKDFATN